MKYYRLIVDYRYEKHVFGIEDELARYHDQADVYVDNEYSIKMKFQRELKIRVSKLQEVRNKLCVKIGHAIANNPTLNIIVNLNEEVTFEYREDYNVGEDSMTNVYICKARLIEDERDFRIPRVLYLKKTIEQIGCDLKPGCVEISDNSGIGEIVQVPKDCSNKEQYEAWLEEFKNSNK